MKSFSVAAGLQHLVEEVDAVAVSSLFEARLARRILGSRQSVHLTTPGLRTDEMAAISELADYISFNSISQWLRVPDVVKDRVSCGLRVNPQISFVQDARYDPCRTASKLGVPLDELRDLIDWSPLEAALETLPVARRGAGPAATCCSNAPSSHSPARVPWSRQETTRRSIRRWAASCCSTG